jgi:hypothetical protein
VGIFILYPRIFEGYFTSSDNLGASVRNFSSSYDGYSKISVSGLLSSKQRNKRKMKVCHMVTVCSLTIMDLPVCSCNNVISQKRISTDGGKETLITPVLKTEILVWIEPWEGYFRRHSIHSVDRTIEGIFQRTLYPHSHRVRKSTAVFWLRVVVAVLPTGLDKNVHNLWMELVIHSL